MSVGSDLVEWFVGSMMAWVLWVAVRDTVVSSAGTGVWLLFTVVLALADMLLLAGIIRKISEE